MHELGLAMEILEIVTHRAEGARVLRVTIEVGQLSAVLPEALRFCFETASQGTAAEGAELVIERPLGVGRCRACAREVQTQSLVATCACGAFDLEWISGDELKVRSLEVS